MKRLWHYLLVEPFTCTRYAFFQPRRLEREFGRASRWQRFLFMLRVIVPMFLLAYPIAVIADIPLILALHLGATVVFPLTLDLVAYKNVAYLLLGIAESIAGGAAAGIVLGSVLGSTRGIAGGTVAGIMLGSVLGAVAGVSPPIAFIIGASIAFGIIAGFSSGFVLGIMLSIVIGIMRGIARGVARGIMPGIALGIVLGIALGIARAISANIVSYIMPSVVLGIMPSSMLGIGAAIVLGIVAGIALGIGGAVVLSMGGAIVEGAVLGIATGRALAIGGAITLGIGAMLAAAITPPIALGILDTLAARAPLFAVSIGNDIVDFMIFPTVVSIGSTTAHHVVLPIAHSTGGIITPDIVLGIVLGIVEGIALGTVLSIVRNITRGIAVGIALGITGAALVIGADTTPNLAASFATGLFLFVCYFVGLFRLPFYFTRGPSVLRAYLVSRKNPSQVFMCLQCSPLHTDEIVHLPLPYLKETLLLAYNQHPERALEEITFIAAEQPRQARAARAALLEIALRDLEKREMMADIPGAAQFLSGLFTHERALLYSQWAIPITRLREASQDADRFCSSRGRKAQFEALADMIKQLNGVYPDVVFADARTRSRLGKVVTVWLALAELEQERLQRLPAYLDGIDNPYNPGNALKPNDPLFSGRTDLAQALEKELMKGERRPTFLMTGERRMGKSSALLRLSRMLGSRFLPVFYDLQSPGIFASTSTFLGALAEGIYKEMDAHCMPVDRLAYKALHSLTPSQTPDSQSLSETFTSHHRYEEESAVTYSVFDRWLRHVESLLEQEDRSLLLLFDEFEKLEEAGLRKAFDLPSLFDWFRTTIQYHPRIALLFSGVRTFSEMGRDTGLNWSGYFVNVQTLRVSFLHEEQARRLITKPVPDFPGESLYGEGVVERIIAETGCHPFLVQAVCSALIDYLNTQKRERAELKDVSRAIDCAFSNWWDTYFRDLWVRTDEQQRACLIALRALTTADREQIQQQSGLDDAVVQRTLQTLLKRDLVRRNEDETYCISTPIFSTWVQRSVET